MRTHDYQHVIIGSADVSGPFVPSLNDESVASPESMGEQSGFVSSSRTSSTILELTSVTKRYESVVALNDVSLKIHRGECFGLLGPNGAGKTTLMSLVAGLWPCDEGVVSLDGRRVVSGSSEIGFVPQHIALYVSLSAEKNLRLFGQLYGLRGAELNARVDEMLEAVQLKDRRRDRVADFSGGMQRRLNLAASLLHRPKLLLCDEPTVGVDPQSRNAIFEFLEQRNKEGLTIIYSTHYMEEAVRLCSRIGIIEHGKILALGSLEELLKHLPFQDEIRFPADRTTLSFAEYLRAYGTVAKVGEMFQFYPRTGYRLSEFYRIAESSDLHPRLFTIQRPTLEAVFLHLTGRALRE